MADANGEMGRVRRVNGREVPTDFTDDEVTVAEALYALTWTDAKPDAPPDWHHQFGWWQCVLAARTAVAALSGGTGQ